MSEESTGDYDDVPSTSSTRKRPKLGRMSDVSKILKNSTHEPGQDCHCKHLKCFQNVSTEERKQLITSFNNMSNRNEQNSYLSGLISVKPVERHRPNNDIKKQI